MFGIPPLHRFGKHMIETVSKGVLHSSRQLKQLWGTMLNSGEDQYWQFQKSWAIEEICGLLIVFRAPAYAITEGHGSIHGCHFWRSQESPGEHYLSVLSLFLKVITSNLCSTLVSLCCTRTQCTILKTRRSFIVLGRQKTELGNLILSDTTCFAQLNVRWA